MARRRASAEHKEVRLGAEILIHELSSTEVRALVGSDIYDSIKRRDDHPAFAKIRFAKEGLSTGYAHSSRFPGIWTPVKKWWKKGIIRELVKKMQPKAGIFKKLFDGHSADNDLTGRSNASYGDIIWAAVKNVVGKLVGEAIAYVQPGYVREALKNRERDIASIEARVGLADENGRVVVSMIDEVFGIVLARSGVDKPGFESAHVLSVIQELETRPGTVIEEEEEEEEPATEPARGGRNRKGRRRMGDEVLSVPEVKTWIGTDSIVPKQLFSSEELAKDETVKGLAGTAVQEAVQNALDKQKSAWDAEKIEIEKKVTDAAAAQKVAEDKAKDLEGQLGPYNEEKKKVKLAKAIKAAETLKDATKDEVAFIIDHVPASVMDIENDAERGKRIQEEIERQQAYIEEKGLTFKETPPEEESEEDEVIRLAREEQEKKGVPPRKQKPAAGVINPMTGEPYNT